VTIFKFAMSPVRELAAARLAGVFLITLAACSASTSSRGVLTRNRI
jgi:hypothetical protein